MQSVIPRGRAPVRTDSPTSIVGLLTNIVQYSTPHIRHRAVVRKSSEGIKKSQPSTPIWTVRIDCWFVCGVQVCASRAHWRCRPLTMILVPPPHIAGSASCPLVRPSFKRNQNCHLYSQFATRKFSRTSRLVRHERAKSGVHVERA